jgi:predicted nucleic acid-binding protein
MIYLDSGVILRLVEGEADVRFPIEARLAAFRGSEPFGITSRLRLECGTKPLREKQADLLRLYEAFFASREIILNEISRDVIEKATDIRAAYGLKAPDAIHAATAMLSGAAEFWTADQGFRRCPDLNVVLFAAV